MEFVCGNSYDDVGKYLGQWFINQTKLPLIPPFAAIGFVEGKYLKGVATFNDYTGSSVEIHLHAPKCLTAKSIKFVYNYIFNDLGCNIFIAKPHRKNKNLIKILNRLNKDAYKCVIPNYYGPTKDEDAILFVFTKEWARNWIKINAKSAENTACS